MLKFDMYSNLHIIGKYYQMILFVAFHIASHPAQLLLDTAKKNSTADNCAWQPIDKMHLTLHYMGDTSPIQLAEIRNTLNRQLQSTQKLTVKITHMDLLSQNTLVAFCEHTEALQQLQKNIKVALSSFHQTSDKHTFIPHITLAKAYTSAHDSCYKNYETTINLERICLLESLQDQSNYRETS